MKTVKEILQAKPQGLLSISPNATVLEPLYEAATNPAKRKLIVAGAPHGRAYNFAEDGSSKTSYMSAVCDFLDATVTK